MTKIKKQKDLPPGLVISDSWKLDIGFTKLYKGHFRQWVWFYKPYAFTRGFILRICGLYINLRKPFVRKK